MYSAESLFKKLSHKDIYVTLKSFAEEDCYLFDYVDDIFVSEFIYVLEFYDLIWIASNDKLILTQKGERVLQSLFFSVELCKK